MNTLAWGLRVGAEFRRRVVQIAQELGCDPSHLMAVMAFETGRTFSPSVKNPTSSATGLIQFVESTAEGLGTSTSELSEMSAVEQLEYVRAYLLPYKGKLDSLSDCYAAVIWPRAVGMDDGYIVFGTGSDAYAHNSALDVDRNGSVTKGECAAFVRQMLDQGLAYENAWMIEQPEPAPITDLPDVPPRAEPQPEQRMPILALLAAFGPILAQLIPPIAAALDHKSATPAKLDAAGKILEIVTTAAGATNVQQAVEKLQADPVLVKTVTDAIVTAPEVQPYLTIVEVGGGIKEARAVAADPSGLPFWKQGAFVMGLVLTPLVYMVTYQVLWSPDYSEQLRTVVVTAILSGLLGALTGFFFGSMYSTSKRATDTVTK